MAEFNDCWLAADWGPSSDNNLDGILAVAEVVSRNAVAAGHCNVPSPPPVIKAHEIQGCLAKTPSTRSVDHVSGQSRLRAVCSAFKND
jgi:2-methylcitrate dehydratase